MANSGYKQAIIAYRVSVPEGLPVDINGNLTSVSGRKQAIALLQFTPNPNPALYEVQFYYLPRGYVEGEPTAEFTDSCPTGFLYLSPVNITLTTAAPSASIILQSSDPWHIVSGPGAWATIDTTSGVAGSFILNVTRTATLGQGYITFINEFTLETKQIHILNVLTAEWILQTGFWNMSGIWTDTGIWNY